jgi:hypothetical protein
MEFISQLLPFLFLGGIFIFLIKSRANTENRSSANETFPSMSGGVNGSEDVYKTSSNSFAHSTFSDFETTEINPANGLPMIDGIGSIDCEGNAYGFSSDSYNHD